MSSTVAQLTARSLLGRRRVLLLLLLPAILLLLSLTFRLVGGIGQDTTLAVLDGLALGIGVPLLALIAGAGAIGPEIDDGSIVYLLSKPVSRLTIVGSKLSVAVAVVIAAAAVPTLLAGRVLTGGVEGLPIAYGVGAAIAGISYCAVFLLLAVLTRNAVIVGLIYALIWESLIGGFVPGAQVLSIRQWALAISERILGADAAPLGVQAAVSLGAAVPLLLAVTIGAALYAGVRLRGLKLTTNET